MIKKINIENYQSHKKTELELSNGVNVIVGSSGSGKSVILRSINWLINNRPGGDFFRSDWGGETSCKIEINNHVIERVKNDTENLYILDNDYKNPFKAFGQDVPEEIKKILNMSSVNFQYQMDAPFLFSNSSGEVARYINEIINLDIIDKTLANISKIKKQFEDKLNTEREILKQNQDQLSNYENLENIELLINFADKFEKCLDNKKEDKENIELLINNIIDCHKIIEKMNSCIKIEEKVNDFDVFRLNLNKQKDCLSSLISLYNNIITCNSSIEKINVYVGIEKNILEVDGLNSILDNKKVKIEKLKNIIDDLEYLNDSFSLNNLDLDKLNNQFKSLIPKECINKNCPFLGD
jgi:DNA repair exonuclease SbcCD ATPase subunit